ncbi:MAG: CBS domain-containing protein [Myxococcota bacterium]
MRVHEWMTPDLVVVDPTTPAAECRQRMRECGIRTLPVVDDGALVGRVTDAAAFGQQTTDATAGDLMSPVPVLASPDDPLTEVLARCAWAMQDAVYVVDRGQLVGILTEHDVCRHAASELPPHLVVRDAASTTPVCVAAHTRARDALFEMRRRFVRHLVVTDGQRLVGVVSLRDLLVEPKLAALPIGDLVRGPVVWTVGWDTPLREAATSITAHLVGCLPVVPDDRSVVEGVLCRSDLVRALLRWGAVGDDRLRVNA